MSRLNCTIKCAICDVRCVGSSKIAAIAAVAVLLAMSRPAAAAVICQQECASGTCAQASCGKAVIDANVHTRLPKQPCSPLSQRLAVSRDVTPASDLSGRSDVA